MNVMVKFLGIYRNIVGKESIDIEIRDGNKITDLIEHMVKRIGKKEFSNMLIDPELVDPRPNNVILVNGREISSLSGLETELQDGDEVAVIPLIHGG